MHDTLGRPRFPLSGKRGRPTHTGCGEEATRGRVVLGVGVNVNQSADELPADTAKPPTSVRIEAGRELERAPLLVAILRELEAGYDDWLRLYRDR